MRLSAGIKHLVVAMSAFPAYNVLTALNIFQSGSDLSTVRV